jgi:hypothetical protein
MEKTIDTEINIVVICFTILSMILASLAWMVFLINEQPKPDGDERIFLNRYKYNDSADIYSGFYRGCKATLKERVTVYKFKAKLVCKDLTYNDMVEVDARTFSAYVYSQGYKHE